MLVAERLIKILIVEDSLLTRIGILSIYSWKDNGFHVMGAAENGQQALSMIENEIPDIIISDIRMPVMDGLELLREVKRRKLPSRFIMLSAYDDFNQVRCRTAVSANLISAVYFILLLSCFNAFQNPWHNSISNFLYNAISFCERKTAV